MAVRLQMKLGIIAEQDRASDSADTIVVVEPSVGSVGRSKGQLYVIATSNVATARAQEATLLATETIQREYYYDESAGIRVCLQKALATVNKRLLHQRDRLGLGHPGDVTGPIGIGLAVVRGNELYVATLGPAEAYLIRQARLSTLPDPQRERGLPTTSLEPEVWRGEIAVGDSLVLVSPNVMARLGPDELKDAMLTLHPQSAIEHLHGRFMAAGGSGSDAMIAFEATEVAATQRERTLVPVRAAEPLAGAPDRSPIPLADNVTEGVAAVQASARQARVAAGGAFDRLILRLQDLLPRRQTVYRRVTGSGARRETQRRAALAVLAFVVVAAGLAGAVFVVGGNEGSPVASLSAGEAALRTARQNIDQVFAPGVDLVTGDRERATRLLTEAYAALDTAEEARIPAARIEPLREKAADGLDRIFGVVPVAAAEVLSFDIFPAPLDPGDLVQGPDGAPYLLDRATKGIYRIDTRGKTAKVILAEGTEVGGTVAAAPKLMTTGGRHLLVLDANNVLWRWAPADDKGRGTLGLVDIDGAASWGDDLKGIGTYLRNPDAGTYNFYVVDPSEQQILAYMPAFDGSGFPSRASPRLAVGRDLNDVEDLYIDGDIFISDDGTILRFVEGRSEGWEADPPGDDVLRPTPSYSMIASPAVRRDGLMYGYDKANERVVALDKATGNYVRQYRLAGKGPGWEDIRGMYLLRGQEDAPDTLVWITKAGLYTALLEAVADVASSPSPSPSGSGVPASGSPAVSPPASP